MGRMYSAVVDGVAVTAAQDLLEIAAPADAVVVLHRVEVTQDTIETSEQLPVRIMRGQGAVTSGSGGASVTPTPLQKGDPAFGGTVERNNTTIMAVGSGSIVTVGRRAMNLVGSGFLYAPTPEERIVVSPGDLLTINLPTAPAASTTFSVEVIFEEIGG